MKSQTRPWKLTRVGTVLSAVLLMTVAACGSGNPAPAASSAAGGTSSADAALVADRSATLRLATPSAAVPWDPTQAGLQSTSNMYYSLVYDQLLTLDTSGQPAPMLATEFALAPDATAMTLTLRAGVKFDDGSALDSAAVKANLDRGKTLEGSLVAPLLRDLQLVETPDAQTVKLSFSRPSPSFPALLAEDARVSSVVNPAFLTDPNLATTPHGSGPYKLSSQSTSGLSFVRVDGHWDTSSGLASQIEMQIITDNTAKINAIRSGQVDGIVISGAQSSEAQSTADSSGGSLIFNVFGQTASVLQMYPNPEKGLSDPNVRKAISLALDRTATCSVGYGVMALPSQQLFANGVPGWVEELDSSTALTPNLEQAQQLMRDAGVTSMNLEVVLPNFAELVTMFQVFQQQLEPLGITLTSNVQAGSAQAGALFSGGTGDVYWGSSASSFDPGGVIVKNIATGRGFGIPDYLATPVEEASVLPAGPEATAAYEEISRTLVEQPYTIPVCDQLSAQLVSDRVVGVENMTYPLLAPVLDPRHLGLAA